MEKRGARRDPLSRAALKEKGADQKHANQKAGVKLQCADPLFAGKDGRGVLENASAEKGGGRRERIAASSPTLVDARGVGDEETDAARERLVCRGEGPNACKLLDGGRGRDVEEEESSELVRQGKLYRRRGEIQRQGKASKRRRRSLAMIRNQPASL